MFKISEFKTKIMKFRLKFLPRTVDPYYFTRILQNEGFDIGEGTLFYSPGTLAIDRERPWMLKIGKYCKITRGCTILTHDYSRSVLRRKFGIFVGEAAMTEIGDNVFIGVNSIILMGAKIGSNVIIGAGSVVTKNIPDNVVAAGNPAKIVCTLDDFFQRRKDRELTAAYSYFTSYFVKYGRYPSPKSNNPFFSLYSDRSTFDYENDIRLHCNGDNFEDIKRDFQNSESMYNSYEDFIKALIDYEKEAIHT